MKAFLCILGDISGFLVLRHDAAANSRVVAPPER